MSNILIVMSLNFFLNNSINDHTKKYNMHTQKITVKVSVLKTDENDICNNINNAFNDKITENDFQMLSYRSSV